MSSINSETCQLLRSPDFYKPCLPQSSLAKLEPANVYLKSILKTNERTTKIPEVPPRRKRVRFLDPLDDSESYFKGFTTDHLTQIDNVRAKMETIRKALSLKQKTAVWQALRRNHGVIPIKNNSIKAFLLHKKLCSMPTKAANLVETQHVSVNLQPGKLSHNEMTKMKMMQCKVCLRKEFFPKTKQIISIENSFICAECFQRAKLMISKASKMIIQSSSKTAVSIYKHGHHLHGSLKDRPILITNVRSLSTQNILDCHQDGQRQPAMGKTNLESISSSLQNDQIVQVPVQNDVAIARSADLDVKIDNTTTAQGKLVKVWTTEGYMTFIVPKNFKEQTDTFELISGQRSGTPDDPILIDI